MVTQTWTGYKIRSFLLLCLLKYHSHAIKFTLSCVWFYEFWQIYTVLYIPPQSRHKTVYYLKKLPQCTFVVNPQPLPHSWHLFSKPVVVPFPDTQDHTVCSLLCLVSFTRYNPFECNIRFLKKIGRKRIRRNWALAESSDRPQKVQTKASRNWQNTNLGS